MKVKLCSGALGAEIEGIDLKTINSDNFKTINDLLLEHKVIFFREQNMSPEEQIKLAKLFGPVEEHAYVKGLEGYPEITRLIKDAEEKNQWGEGWHSDVSYNETPTKAVVLKSIKIPPVGGDTVFSNMELAWETLDEELKKIVENRRAEHFSLGAGFFIDSYKHFESNGNDAKEYSNHHPIVRTHPETGKKILFVNWTYTKKIEGLEEHESNEVLSKIFEHQSRLDLTCRYSWTENNIAIWDNRCVIHYAIADFFPGRGLGYERVMDRIAVLGDRPY